jgi:hypothetical protein
MTSSARTRIDAVNQAAFGHIASVTAAEVKDAAPDLASHLNRPLRDLTPGQLRDLADCIDRVVSALKHSSNICTESVGREQCRDPQ